MSQKLLVKIESDNEREVDNLSNDLVSYIKSLKLNEDELKRNKENNRTQDLGSIIAIVLGSSSVTLLARGLSDWLGRTPSAKISVTDENGKLGMDAQNVTSKDTVRLMNAFGMLKEQKNS